MSAAEPPKMRREKTMHGSASSAQAVLQNPPSSAAALENPPDVHIVFYNPGIKDTQVHTEKAYDAWISNK